MNKKYLTAFLLAPLGLLAGTTPNLQAKRPNIVIILTDDMGYSDPGCFGGEIQTPNLDKLAATGIRFTQFYNCARCCPSRASLLTGQYPQKAGINGLKTEFPAGKNLMPMILGKTNSVHDTLFWEHQGGKAIRVGDWKMSARKDSPWEIFNLAKDRNEAINLAGQFPDKEKELNAAWEKWAGKMKINIK